MFRGFEILSQLLITLEKLKLSDLLLICSYFVIKLIRAFIFHSSEEFNLKKQ